MKEIVNEYKEYFLYDQLNDIKICTLDKQFFSAEIFNSKCKTFTDYNDLYVLMAVNTTYPYDTNLSYYVKDVVTSKKEIMQYAKNEDADGGECSARCEEQ